MPPPWQALPRLAGCSVPSPPPHPPQLHLLYRTRRPQHPRTGNAHSRSGISGRRSDPPKPPAHMTPGEYPCQPLPTRLSPTPLPGTLRLPHILRARSPDHVYATVTIRRMTRGRGRSLGPPRLPTPPRPTPQPTGWCSTPRTKFLQTPLLTH